MGIFVSSGQFIGASVKLRWLFRYPRSEPDFMTWSFPHQIKLTSGRHSKRTHMGIFVSSGQFIGASVKLRWLFRYPRSEPDSMTWSFPHQIQLTYGRRSQRLHQYPAFGGSGLRRSRPFFHSAV